MISKDDLLTWPDLGPKISQNVCNECPLKDRKFQFPISSRLAMAREKPEGGGLLNPPASNGVKGSSKALSRRGSIQPERTNAKTERGPTLQDKKVHNSPEMANFLLTWMHPRALKVYFRLETSIPDLRWLRFYIWGSSLQTKKSPAFLKRPCFGFVIWFVMVICLRTLKHCHWKYARAILVSSLTPVFP